MSELLPGLYKNVHRFFWLGVEYDWEKNPDSGKIWVYKDCTGIEIRSVDFVDLEKILRTIFKIK